MRPRCPVRRRVGEQDVIDQGEEVVAEAFRGLGDVAHGGGIVDEERVDGA